MARSTWRAALLFLAVNRSPANCLVSVIVLNYNGLRWLERCLNSLRAQTLFDQMEVILADNASSDGSDQLGKGIVEAWPAGIWGAQLPDTRTLHFRPTCHGGWSAEGQTR